jgi:hypothetical protein
MKDELDELITRLQNACAQRDEARAQVRLRLAATRSALISASVQISGVMTPVQLLL